MWLCCASRVRLSGENCIVTYTVSHIHRMACVARASMEIHSEIARNFMFNEFKISLHSNNKTVQNLSLLSRRPLIRQVSARDMAKKEQLATWPFAVWRILAKLFTKTCKLLCGSFCTALPGPFERYALVLCKFSGPYPSS